MSSTTNDNTPVIHKTRDIDGTVRSYVPLADYDALMEAAVDLCSRMSALPQVIVPAGGGQTVLDLVRGTKVREAA